ncbi:MAG TPA: dTDP-4-dehydrorhamnose reductase [Porphyromonadaceae bacterium]|nr:dTDP-4-dehydrorhamnose reductase [Porphyromonadaceae bacterium]
MNVLVTGSNGQLGNEMQRLGKKSPNRYIFSDIIKLEGCENAIQLDITNLTELRRIVKEEGIEVIVNCAAYTNVEKAEDDYKTADLINHTATSYLAEVCKEVNATLIHVSTDYVFGGDAHTPYKEEQSTNPLGVYGKTKYDGEQSILSSGCKYIILRTAWLYSSFGGNFVKTMMKLTKEKEELKVVFDQVGTPTFAGDLANAIFQIVEGKLFVGKEGIYHYTNEGMCSWYDFAVEICDLCHHSCSISPCHTEEFPTRAKRPHFSVLDKSKFKKTFNLSIPHWKKSLRVCIEELQSK